MNHRPHNPFNKADTELYREECRIDEEQRRIAREEAEERRWMHDEDDEDDMHVEPRERY